GRAASGLDIVYMLAQLWHPRLEAADDTAGVHPFVSPLALADADVADVDDGGDPRAVAHRLVQGHEGARLQAGGVLDQQLRPRPLAAQPAVHLADGGDV